MFVFGDRVVCTAADLVRTARCEFALLRALDAELGAVDGPVADSAAAVAPDDRLHERMRARHGAAIVDIPRTDGVAGHPEDPAAAADLLRAAHAATVRAVRAGATVIRGAAVFDGGFAARCDYLVREGHSAVLHAVAPTPRARLTALLELAGCAAILVESGLLPDPAAARQARADAPTITLVIHCGGDASTHSYPAAAAVYRERRRRVAAILEDKLAELLPVQWGDPRYLACGQCATCRPALTAARDLLLVAGMSRPARARLRAAGVHTVDRLATATEVPGLSPRTVTALRRQAEMQTRAEAAGGPAYALLDADALAALPPAAPGDLALTVDLDPDGLPRRVELGDADGVLLAVDGPFGTAAADTRTAVTRVLERAAAHLREHPGAHLYHYTGAVRATLLRYAGGPADEEILDELLRAGALVDLYPIVRNALLIGAGSYRLDSVRALLPGASTGIETVLRLPPWLRGLAPRARADAASAAAQPDSWYAPPRSAADPAPPRPSSLEAALTEYAAGQGDPQHPAGVMAAVLGYQRRERRASSWAHADRLTHPVHEWADAPGVLIAEWGAVNTKWHRSPDHTTMRRFLTLTGRIGAGGGVGGASGVGPAASGPLAPGTRVHTFYDRPVALGRRATATAVVLGCAVDADFDDTVRLEEILPEGWEPVDELPTAIAPGVPEWDEHIEAAVEAQAQRLLMTLPDLPTGAFFDILARRAPRLRNGGPLPPVHGDHAAALTAAVADLDGSYLAVQGPSGTGKTSTTARTVARMVTGRHWRVGVVAQSHATVESMFDAIVAAGVLPELVGKADAVSVAPEWVVIDADRYPRFLDNAVNGCVIGGLPSDFADSRRVPAGGLDLLVIADAGRFPLAEVAAVAGTARNLLLLGDPQPATPRAAHPAAAAESVLGWLSEGRDTVPAHLGYFLDSTWRMHPRVCEPLARLYYDGRLAANETVTTARQLDGVTPGIETVTVTHRGDSTESVAEAREVVRQVRGLLGRPWTAGGATRRLHPHDLFVVAPYDAQVGRIRTLLARAKIDDVLVGTVDRFRGREAAVVLVSMTTSAPEDAPHGTAALFSPGLIRAAVGRAMWKAIVIRSPLLTSYLPDTPEELTDLARFLRLG
ncbi:hypothetical protein IU447_21145 [Nocardia farcinica]|nr:hypothetical protein [Nocardia farcinica]